MRNFFIVALSVELALSCTKGAGTTTPTAGTASPDAASETKPAEEAKPSDEKGTGDDGGADGGTDSFKTLNALDMNDVLALGLVESQKGTKLNLLGKEGGESDETEARSLSTYTTAGKLKKIKLSSLGLSANATVENLIDAGTNGVFLRGDFGSLDNGTEQPPSVSLIWMKPDGSMKALIGKDFGQAGQKFAIEKIQYTSDGRIWILFDVESTRAVGFYQLATGVFTKVTDNQQDISGFVATQSGSVFIQGQVVSTNAGFKRRIKSGGTGFEVMNTMPEVAFGNYTFGALSSQVGDWYSGTEVVKIENDQLSFRFLPISIVDGIGTDPAVVGNKWLISKPTSKNLIAFDVSTATYASNPFHRNSIQMDREARLFFDGANVVQIDVTGNKIASTTYRTLKYAKSNGMLVTALFGSAQGFSGNWRAILSKADGTAYLTEVEPATGTVNLDGRLKLVDASGASISAPDYVLQIGTKIIAMAGTDKAFLFGSPDTDSGLQPTTPLAFIASHSLVSHFRRGIIHNNKIYYPDDNFIKSYDPSTDSIADVQDLMNPTCFNAHTLFEVSDGNGGTKPAALLADRCSLTGSETYFATYSNWTNNFTAADIGTPVITALPYNSWGYTIFYDKNGIPLVQAGESNDDIVWALGNNYLGATSINTAATFSTPEAFTFGTSFQNNDIEVVAPWGSDRILVAGLIDNEYRVRLANLTSRTEKQITSLAGIQVYYAKTIGDKVVINGLNVDTNERISKTFNLDESLFSEESESGLKVVQLIETSKAAE